MEDFGRISALLQQGGMSAIRNDYSSAADEISFDSVEEAHFQYLTLWFMHFQTCEAVSHLIDIKRPI